MSVDTPLGQVLQDEFGMRLEFVRLVDLPIDRVWAAFTDSDLLGRWFGTWTGDPAEGQVMLRVNESPEDAYPDAVNIVACEAPNRLEVVLPSPEGNWPLSVELQPRGADGTFLVFAHRLAEPYDASSIGPGWHYYLDRMEAVAAGAEPTSDWDAYYPLLAERYSLPD
jgi:uncharacterized protein YndB with AHSA1/START domain